MIHSQVSFPNESTFLNKSVEWIIQATHSLVTCQHSLGGIKWKKWLPVFCYSALSAYNMGFRKKEKIFRSKMTLNRKLLPPDIVSRCTQVLSKDSWVNCASLYRMALFFRLTVVVLNYYKWAHSDTPICWCGFRAPVSLTENMMHDCICNCCFSCTVSGAQSYRGKKKQYLHWRRWLKLWTVFPKVCNFH